MMIREGGGLRTLAEFDEAALGLAVLGREWAGWGVVCTDGGVGLSLWESARDVRIL